MESAKDQKEFEVGDIVKHTNGEVLIITSFFHELALVEYYDRGLPPWYVGKSKLIHVSSPRKGITVTKYDIEIGEILKHHIHGYVRVLSIGDLTVEIVEIGDSVLWYSTYASLKKISNLEKELL